MLGLHQVASMPVEQPSTSLELRHAATDRAMIVVVPERRLLAIDGVGGPEASDFRFASVALRTAAKLIRDRILRTRSIETRIGVIECAWWIHPEVEPDRMADAFTDRTSWHWQQMIEIPDSATDDDVAGAVDQARREAGRETSLVRQISFTEGRAAQILHIGGAADEPESVRKLYRAVVEAGLEPRGHLHQIILSDPVQVPAGRGRSILRLPIAPH